MTLGYTRVVLFWGSKVKGQGHQADLCSQSHSTVNVQYLPNGKAYEVQSWYTDGARRPVSATSAVTSKVKGEGRKVTWRVWQVLADKSKTKRPIETPKLVGRLPWPSPRGPRATCLQVSRSKVKVTWSITLHVKYTSFRTTIAFSSYSLGGDTSTITLPSITTELHCHSLLARLAILTRATRRWFAHYEYILVFQCI